MAGLYGEDSIAEQAPELRPLKQSMGRGWGRISNEVNASEGSLWLFAAIDRRRLAGTSDLGNEAAFHRNGSAGARPRADIAK